METESRNTKKSIIKSHNKIIKDLENSKLSGLEKAATIAAIISFTKTIISFNHGMRMQEK